MTEIVIIGEVEIPETDVYRDDDSDTVVYYDHEGVQHVIMNEEH